jgi:hypothetical protein
MPRTQHELIPESDAEVLEEVIVRQRRARGVRIEHKRIIPKTSIKAKATSPKKPSGSRRMSKARIQHQIVEEAIPESDQDDRSSMESFIGDDSGDGAMCDSDGNGGFTYHCEPESSPKVRA